PLAKQGFAAGEVERALEIAVEPDLVARKGEEVLVEMKVRLAVSTVTSRPPPRQASDDASMQRPPIAQAWARCLDVLRYAQAIELIGTQGVAFKGRHVHQHMRFPLIRQPAGRRRREQLIAQTTDEAKNDSRNSQRNGSEHARELDAGATGSIVPTCRRAPRTGRPVSKRESEREDYHGSAAPH